MTHRDHVTLIRKGIAPGGVWADFGSGTGAFTLALRDLGGPDLEIYSIDKNALSLKIQRDRFNHDFPHTRIHYVRHDYTHSLLLPKLNGILMANSLHFIKDKIPLLIKLRTYLKPQGILMLVEYNADVGNAWVPYPTSESMLQQILIQSGFSDPLLLHRVPSDFLEEIYSMRAINLVATALVPVYLKRDEKIS